MIAALAIIAGLLGGCFYCLSRILDELVDWRYERKAKP